MASRLPVPGVGPDVSTSTLTNVSRMARTPGLLAVALTRPMVGHPTARHRRASAGPRPRADVGQGRADGRQARQAGEQHHDESADAPRASLHGAPPGGSATERWPPEETRQITLGWIPLPNAGDSVAHM